jgi:hypothetical protein
LANELTRVGDRLARARERSWTGAARVVIPSPARREPDHAEIPPEPRESRRDAGAQAKRAPATLVAIHVEVRHPTGDAEPTARVIDAHVSELSDETERYVDVAAAVDDGPERPALVAQLEPAIEQIAPIFALPAPAPTVEAGSTSRARSSGVLFMAARALSAYLTQHAFGARATGEPPLLDLRA